MGKTIEKFGKSFRIPPVLGLHLHPESVQISMSVMHYGRPELTESERVIYDIILSNVTDDDNTCSGDSLYEGEVDDSVAYWSAIEIASKQQ